MPFRWVESATAIDSHFSPVPDVSDASGKRHTRTWRSRERRKKEERRKVAEEEEMK